MFAPATRRPGPVIQPTPRPPARPTPRETGIVDAPGAAARRFPAYLPLPKPQPATGTSEKSAPPAHDGATVAAPKATADPVDGGADKGPSLAEGVKAGTVSSSASGGRRVKHENEEAVIPVVETVPMPTTGTVELDREPLKLIDPSASFDGPTDLGFRPDRKAGAKPEQPTPEVASYLSVFAEAAQAARRLHDALIDEARQATSAARAAASARTDQRQNDLSMGLARLDGSLDMALGDLAGRTAAALALLDQRASEARGLIRASAMQAYGALNAAAARVNTAKAGAETRREATQGAANKYREALTKAGLGSTEALTKIGAKPEQYFPDSTGALAAAIQEAIVTRVPKRAQQRLEAYGKELKAQTKAMDVSFKNLPSEFDGAFEEVAQWIKQTGTLGPAAVGSAREAALKQLRRMLRQLRPSMRSAQARTASGLVRQHDAARKQLIVAHRNRARSEMLGDTHRADRDVTAIRALGLAQSASLRTIADNLKRDRTRSEKDLARSVVTTAHGFAKRLEATDTGQRPRLVAAASEGLEASRRQSRVGGIAIAGSSESIALQMERTANDSGEALVTQANETSTEFDKLAGPVAKSISGYLPPVGKAFDNKICCLNAAVDGTQARVHSYMSDKKSEDKGAACDCGPKGGAHPSAEAPPDPPASMIPNEFIEMANKVGAHPETDAKIADLAERAPVEIESKMKGKSQGVWDNAGPIATHTEPLMKGLRSITARQGKAIKTDFRDRLFGEGIETYIRRYLPKLFSAESTDQYNIDAAINYLNGNAIEGALNDLKAAVNYSNEELRVEAIQRSLKPEQWAELKRLHGGDIKDVRDDLDGVDQQVFDALDKEGDNFLASKGKKDSESTVGLGVAEADALRLREKMGNELKTRGDKGADTASDSVNAASGNAGNDVILGKDTLDLDDRAVAKDKPGFDNYDSVADRNKRQWERTKTAFDKLETADGKAPEGARAGWSIAQFAAREREYEEVHGYGENAYSVTVKDKIRDEQTQLIQTIVDFGPDSEEAAAARVQVEMSRTGGAKPERLQMAMLDGSLDAHEGEDRAKLAAQKDHSGKSEMDRRLEGARARQTRVLVLFDRLKKGEKLALADTAKPVKKPTEEEDRQNTATADRVRIEMQGHIMGQVLGDPTAAQLNMRAVRHPETTWSAEQQERKKDAKAAFDHAIAHEDQRGDTLKSAFGRMDKDEIQGAVDSWDAERKPGEESLYAQLNLFGKGSWWTEKLSGDERNDVELSARGIARNTEERALTARFRAEQQIRDAGWLGKLAGKVTGDWDRLVESRDDLERQMGVPHGAFNAMGDAIGHGHFIDGEFKPPAGGSAAQLEVAMRMTHLTAESYKAMTDRLATAVTTGLMIAAAVLTTALTGGAAASIWIPLLVTMGAGLVGMALSASIKGNRYSRAEMERDLVMTFVQAATAGLGAAAGTAIKGGMPALRMVATEMKVAETILEDVAKVSGAGLSKGEAMVAELGVAGASNAINNSAAAAMDPANRVRGQSGEKALDAALSGFFSGAFGSMLMKPAGALGGKAFGKAGERALGSAANNMGTRAFEIFWQQRTGQRASGQTADVTDELVSAGGQGLVQGALEHATVGDAHGPRKSGGRTAKAGAGRATLHEPSASRVAEELPAAKHPAADSPAPGPARAPAPEPIVLPVPAELASVVDAAKPLRPDALPPVVHEPAPPSDSGPPPAAKPVEEPHLPAVPRAANDNEPVTQRRPVPAEEEPATQHRPVPAGEEHHATQRRLAAAEEEATTPHPLQQPEPEWLAQQKNLPPGSVAIDPEPGNPRKALDDYQARIRKSPGREVAIYRNAETDQFIVVQGNESSAFVAILKGGKHEAPMPGGREQGWKAILLGHDVGNWQLVAHFHPVEGGGNTAGMPRRLPSGKGGDLSAMAYESHAAGGAARQSRVHYLQDGEFRHTDFGFDPHLAGGPYWVEFEHPVTGVREKHSFPTTEAYHGFFEDVTGRPMRETGTTAPAASEPARPAATPREDDSVFYHGTTAKGQAAMEAEGITARRNAGKGDDHGPGFYVTPQEAVGGDYARERSASADRAGEPSEGRVLKFRVSREDMGVVVDIRPGGEHRAAFEAFMSGPSPFAGVPRREHLPQTIGEFIVTYGHDMRGEYFEQFLSSIGMSHADAIHGDLGGIGTAGIGAGHPGAEQIAIRSQRLADLLAAQLPGRAPIVPDLPEVPRAAEAGPVVPRAANDREPPAGKRATAPAVDEPAVEQATEADAGKAPGKRDRGQGRRKLDPDASARAALGLESAEQSRRDVVNESALAQARLMSREEASARLASERPPLPPDVAERLVQSRKDAEAESRRTETDPKRQKLAVVERRLEHIGEWLTEPTLSAEARHFLEWQAKALSFQLRQEESLQTVVSAPQAEKEAHAIDIPKAEAAQRDANRGVKDLVEMRGENYKAMKKNATHDEILGETRFATEQKLRAAAGGKPPLALSPDHLVPLDEIANMKELVPLLNLYKEAPPAMREKLEIFLRGLGDVRENLVAMRSDANEHLKNSRDWKDVSLSKALEYGYNQDDIVKMSKRQAAMRVKLKKLIADAIEDFKAEVTKTPATGRRAELAIAGDDPDNEKE